MTRSFNFEFSRMISLFSDFFGSILTRASLGTLSVIFPSLTVELGDVALLELDDCWDSHMWSELASGSGSVLALVSRISAEGVAGASPTFWQWISMILAENARTNNKPTFVVNGQIKFGTYDLTLPYLCRVIEYLWVERVDLFESIVGKRINDAKRVQWHCQCKEINPVEFCRAINFRERANDKPREL
jgi:hypothetical protein